MTRENPKRIVLMGRVLGLRHGDGSRRVEAWDVEGRTARPSAVAAVDAAGRFRIRLDAAKVARGTGARWPRMEFRVYAGDELVARRTHALDPQRAEVVIDCASGDQADGAAIDMERPERAVTNPPVVENPPNPPVIENPPGQPAPAPPPPQPPPPLIKLDLIKIDRLSSASLKQLRAQDPELAIKLQARVAAERRARVLAQLVSGSSELQQQLEAVDFSPGDQPDRSLKEVIFDSLQAQQVKPEIAREAVERVLDLERNGLLADPAEVDRPLKEHPLFQGELQQAATLKLADLANLPDVKAETVAARVGDPAAISDESLDALVKARVLEDREARELGLTVSLYHLLDERLDAVDAVKKAQVAAIPGGRVTQVRDLVGLRADDWLKVLEGAKIPPPAGMDAKAYAAQLSRRVATLFPTEALFARALPKSTQDVGPALDRLKPLLDRNPIAFGRPFDSLKTDGIAAADLAAMRTAHAQLQRIANILPGMRLNDVLNDKSASAQKAQVVAKRLDLLNRVVQLNPTAELLTLDYAADSADRGALQLTGVAPDEQRLLLSTLKAYQRAFAITDDVDDAQTLLEAGYQSATAIAAETPAAFQRKSGLAGPAAEAYYEAARSAVAAVTTAATSIADTLGGGFEELSVANTAPAILDHLRKLDGFADLFGRQDHCRCEHCQSILSPVAYFVDLMTFIEEHVLDVVFGDGKRTHPLHLRVRRSDLWTLPLTCANTTESVSYLDLINEILENAVAVGRGFSGNLADRAAVEEAVYHQALATATDSFRQPFVLPLERLSIYLAHFARSRATVARALSAPAPLLAASTLEVPRREYELIIQASTDLAFLRKLYGVQFTLPAGGKIDPVEPRELLRFTGLSREELGELVETSFVTQAGAQPVEIRSEKASPESVQNDIERVRGLTPQSLDRLHRFARVRRRLPWSVRELDLVLAHLAKTGLASGITEPALQHLATILGLQERWALPVEENCALWSELPRVPVSTGQESLFDRLFNSQRFVMADGPLPKPAIKFIHPSFRNVGVPSPADNTLHRLLAGLGVSDEQLSQLLSRLATPLGMNLGSSNENDRGFLLTPANLTLLYRHARVAARLLLSVPELFQLIRVAGIAGGHLATLAHLGALLDFYDWWRASGFTLDDLGIIIGGPVQQPGPYPDPEAVAAQLVADVQAEKALDFADSIFAFLPAVSEEQSRRIVAANAAVIEPARDGTMFRLRPTFNPGSPLTIPTGVTVAEPAARELLLRHHASAVLPTKLAGRLDLAVDQASALLAMIGISFSDPALLQALHGGALTALSNLVRKLIPLAILFRHRVFDGQALEFVRTHPGIFAITSFSAIGIESVRKLSVYVTLTDTPGPAADAQGAPPEPGAVQQVLAAFSPTQGLANADRGALARVLHADAGLLSSLLSNLTLPVTAPEALTMLRGVVDLAQSLGVGGETLKLIVSDAYDDLSRASEAIFGAFRAKYPEERKFLEQLEPFEDRIRSRKRDALTDFVLRSIRPELQSMNDLYAYFLVDVQLDGCARTSRVAAGIASLQLYVHRCLMNLEQDGREPTDPAHVHVHPDSIPGGEWAWRKNYRVWEANRKVFLYPENYLEPELRDDKTPLFRELESALLQREIEEQNVLDAYAAYLSGFDELAGLRIAGAYHDRQPESNTDVLHLFGVTPGDPPVYYYRTVENAIAGETNGHGGVVYTPWRKIDVQIPARKVAPVVYEARLYVFWVEIVSTPKNEVKEGTSTFIGYKHRLSLKYTSLRLDGSWTPPQSITLSGPAIFSSGDGIVEDPLREPAEAQALTAALKKIPPDIGGIATALMRMQTPKYDTRRHPEPLDGYTLTGFQWDQVYPEIAPDGSLVVTGRHFAMRAGVDFYERTIVPRGVRKPQPSGIDQVLCSRVDSGIRRLYYGIQPSFALDGYAQCTIVADQRRLDALSRTAEVPVSRLSSGLYVQPIGRLGAADEIAIINGSLTDAIIDAGGDLLLLQGSVRPGPEYLLKRLGTTLGGQLSRRLFTGGVDALLHTDAQAALREAPPSVVPIARIQTAVTAGRLDFTGSYGAYYREIFLHTPFLIASHLQRGQRFAAAQRWYHYIFDPTASDAVAAPESLPPAERAKRQRERMWRYLEFRNLDVPRLRDVLTDPAAIAVYKRDPFNPHAIARLRLSAYQKGVVMKYIDNLLDWGDSLFAQFTPESVNEATLLYVMASDILGPRPAQIGECGEAQVDPRTYETIAPFVRKGSEFLVELETYLWSRTGVPRTRGAKKQAVTYVVDRATAAFHARTLRPGASLARQNGGASLASENGGSPRVEAAPAPTRPTSATPDRALARPYAWNTTRTGGWTTVRDEPARMIETDSPLISDFERVPSFGWSLVRQLAPVFCVPPNMELLRYWDRVDDRLYKIRHCLDIAGARRALPLFAPEIDPRLLARVKAAGLSLDDVLNTTSGDLPPYRFVYLIEKAKQYGAAVQGFGVALLGALEKRDLEELTLLRTVHQQHLLRLGTRLREMEVEVATDTITTLERQQAAIEYRKRFYHGLLDTRLLASEREQLLSRHLAAALHNVEAGLGFLAGALHLLPQLGSPFAMKYGGSETGSSAHRLAVANRAVANVLEETSAAAGLTASFARREEGWQHQIDLADHELKQIEKQLTAARLRKDIALRSNAMHAETLEQTEEVFRFYGERFTNLGLFSWLATTLQRAYRDAYANAYAMARLAEQAYRFERNDDPAPLVQSNAWDASRAGLLAGERLLLDLQGMERRFIETNYRCLEVDQSFSLMQLSPAALIQLREAASCEFTIPEVFFDLFYPGHYRRKIKSVRLTIPCVTGPYTNVSATLTLTASKVRREPKVGAAFLADVPLRRSVTIATSTAQNDAGVLDFSFRDERYMPFEEAGAVSSWRLSLPKNFRQFDYQSITDVILHVSYTAETDPLLRETVEQLNATLEGTILNQLAIAPLARALSLRQDFSSALNRLLHGPMDTPVAIEVTNKYLPLGLRGRSVQVSKALLALRTPAGQTVNGVQIAINGVTQTGFSRDPQLGNLWTKNLGTLFASGFLKDHTVAVKAAGELALATPLPGSLAALDAAKLLDVVLYIEYRVASSV